MKTAIGIGAVVALAGAAHAQVGLVDFDGTETGLISYTNSVVSGANTSASNTSSSGITSWGPGDASWPMSRSFLGPNGSGMPFNISDDGVSPAAGNTTFTSDVLGFAHQALGGNGFFGVTDTVNGANPGNTVSADFRFDISGAGNVAVNIDFAAMGDFEASGTNDFFNFFYEIDGGGLAPLFTSNVREDLTQNYNMDATGLQVIDDPIEMNGVLLNDVFQTLKSPFLGSGNELRIFFQAQTDGGEGFGFDNIVVKIPTPGSVALLGIAGLAAIRRRR